MNLWHAAFCLLLLSGCVNIERGYPDKHYFTLEAAVKEDTSNQKPNGTLELSDLTVSRRYDSANFVYRISETGYESDFYNQFLIPPAALIFEEVRNALTASHIFEHVITRSSDLQPTYRLEGIVNAIYGDFRNMNAPRAVLEAQFFVTNQTGRERQVLLDRTYSKAIPISGRTPEALVKGWNEALDAILNSLIVDLKAATPVQEVAPPSLSSPALRGGG